MCPFLICRSSIFFITLQVSAVFRRLPVQIRRFLHHHCRTVQLFPFIAAVRQTIPHRIFPSFCRYIYIAIPCDQFRRRLCYRRLYCRRLCCRRLYCRHGCRWSCRRFYHCVIIPVARLHICKGNLLRIRKAQRIVHNRYKLCTRDAVVWFKRTVCIAFDQPCILLFCNDSLRPMSI